jgi:hypothetical protein
MGVEELFPVRGSDLLQTLALSSSAQPLVMAAIANAKQGSPRPYLLSTGESTALYLLSTGESTALYLQRGPGARRGWI